MQMVWTLLVCFGNVPVPPSVACVWMCGYRQLATSSDRASQGAFEAIESIFKHQSVAYHLESSGNPSCSLGNFLPVALGSCHSTLELCLPCVRTANSTMGWRNLFSLQVLTVLRTLRQRDPRGSATEFTLIYTTAIQLMVDSKMQGEAMEARAPVLNLPSLRAPL